MEQRISLVTLGVADLARSGAFYQTLGWRASGAGGEGVVFYQAGGMVLALFGRAALAADAGLEDRPTGFAGLALAYNARSRSDVDLVFAEAVAAGARPVKTPRDVFWGGYSGYFADPDDHLWEVAWNPHFRLDPEGRLILPE